MNIANTKNWLAQEFTEKEFVEVVAKYAPFLTPLAPAAVAVAGMATALHGAYGGLGWIWATCSGLGMEGTGYLSSYLLIKAIKRDDFISALLSIIFLGGYAGFAIKAMSTIPNSSTFQFFVAMSIVTYLAVGLLTYDNKREKAVSEKKRQELADRERENDLQRAEDERRIATEKADAEIAIMREQAEISRLNAERLLQNAQNRSANRSGVRHAKDEQTNSRLNPERLESVRAFVKSNPGASVRAVCEGCNISSTDTASRYMKAVDKD